ncbi:MAG: BadF/BadG/BcrA/BcrD type ATPase, partial [Chloroflexi bacterium]|nr:BadF/BadG/BcrA/BcrD type ATPase [Chloroflexota bacterium]
GGWGFLIGDEGSAYDLARRALNAITQAADGRGEKTRMVEMILQFWKLKAPMEIIPRVYRSDLKPAEFAQLAPLVLRAAEAGDAVAREIISDAARELALAIFAVARALRFAEEKIPLALAGGLLLGAELLQKELWARLKENFAPIALVREPVVGAVKIARELARP